MEEPLHAAEEPSDAWIILLCIALKLPLREPTTPLKMNILMSLINLIKYD